MQAVEVLLLLDSLCQDRAAVASDSPTVARDSPETNGCSGVSIKLYLWMQKFESHATSPLEIFLKIVKGFHILKRQNCFKLKSHS